MKVINLIIFLVSLSVIYVQYQINEFSDIQLVLYTDMGEGVYKESSTSRFDNYNMDFPNLSLSALPIKGIVARYYLLGGRFNEALELLDQSMNDNPYIMFNESLKSDLYWELQITDSIVYYAAKAFSGIPNNQKHFINLARAYVHIDKYEKLDSIFKIVEKKAVPDIVMSYLSSLLTDEEKISQYGKEIAKKIITRDYEFGEVNDEIKVAAQYVLVGQENVSKIMELDLTASDNFNKKNYSAAGKLYEQILEKYPFEFAYYENAGISHFQAGDYDAAIRNLTIVADSLNPGTGKAEFVISQALYNLGKIEEACAYAYRASEYDYRESFKLIGLYCK